jgi:hypothetical protein
MPSERPLNEANIVVFGGSHGIGRATAVALGQRGASVLVVSRGREAGEAAAADIKAAGAKSADFLAGDLSTIAGVKLAPDSAAAWRPALSGVMHTAMGAFKGKTMTSDGLEFAFALQYMARASLNRLLLPQLAASGDGRILHIAGDVPGLMKPDLDDLQFEHRKWSFFKSVLGTHILGFMHIQEAAKRWQGQPVTIAASCVGSTKTKAMTDPIMPLAMRLMAVFGTTPEVSAVNAIKYPTAASAAEVNSAVLRNPKKYEPKKLRLVCRVIDFAYDF